MTVEAFVQGFGCLPDPVPYSKAKAVVIPVPLELGGGEAPGVALGPLAVLGASRFVETFDAELGIDPVENDVATIDAVSLSYEDYERPFVQIQTAVENVLNDGKLPLCLGGERTIALAVAGACSKRREGDVGAVLLTRNLGLLDDDSGRSIAPATIGRRLSERLPLAILGPRFWSADEASYMKCAAAPKVVTARQLEREQSLPKDVVTSLPNRILLSIDVGVLDPAFLPMPGNVEPGGLDWLTLTSLIDEIFTSFEVVCCDVSGFIPVLANVAPSILVAQLVLRCLGCALSSEPWA